MSEGILGMPEEILAINEGDCAFFGRFAHACPLMDNPAGAFRQIRRGCY